MKIYEVRYYSAMIGAMALHSEHLDIGSARVASDALRRQVTTSSLSQPDKAQILKSIAVW